MLTSKKFITLAAYCENVPSNMRKMLRFGSSCACAKYHPALWSSSFYSAISKYSVSRKQRAWSDCVDAQAELGLRCPHMSEDTFSQGTAHMTSTKRAKEPQRETTYRLCTVRTTKTQTSLRIRAVRLVFGVRMKKLCILGYQNCTRLRLSADCAKAQANLSVRWEHMSDGTFSDVAAKKLWSRLNINAMLIWVENCLTTWPKYNVDAFQCNKCKYHSILFVAFGLLHVVDVVTLQIQ